jgi:hypothetical protein
VLAFRFFNRYYVDVGILMLVGAAAVALLFFLNRR